MDEIILSVSEILSSRNRSGYTVCDGSGTRNERSTPRTGLFL